LPIYFQVRNPVIVVASHPLALALRSQRERSRMTEEAKTICFGAALVVGACGVLYVISHLVVG
jgi:hypothetical protein